MGVGQEISEVYDIGYPVSGNSCGSGGEVLECRRQNDGNEFAVKRIAKRISNEGKSQIIIMEQLNHPNITQLIDWFEDSDHIFVVMELAKGGDLFDRILKLGRMPEADAAIIFQQVLLGVGHMHSQGIAHCDLKPENILFMSANENVVKIADFGFSQSVLSATHALRHQGTYSYSAPEMIDEKEFDESADMWSLGVLLFAMIAGFSPFGQGTHGVKVANKIRKGQLNFNHVVFKTISAHAIDLISKLVVVCPRKRLSAEDALRHPWLAMVDAKAPVVASRTTVFIPQSVTETDCLISNRLLELRISEHSE